MQTRRQGWGKAQDSFLPPLRRSRLGEGRSYLTQNQSWPCHLPMIDLLCVLSMDAWWNFSHELKKKGKLPMLVGRNGP